MQHKEPARFWFRKWVVLPKNVISLYKVRKREIACGMERADQSERKGEGERKGRDQ